jgi:hypothetical protein
MGNTYMAIDCIGTAALLGVMVLYMMTTKSIQSAIEYRM